MSFRAGMQTLLQIVYPPRCLSCGDMVSSDFGLCSACWAEAPFISGLTCDLCGIPLPGASDRAEHCDACQRVARPWQKGRAALLYTDKARRLVLALKHGDRHDIARPAGLWMARPMRSLMTDGTVVIPVPLHLHRHLARRYNQAALLGQSLAQVLQVPHIPDGLLRPKPTASLEGKTREERFSTLSGRIAVNPARKPQIEGRQVFLVDDVMTSGATLAAASEACLSAGASEVCVCVLARVGKDT